MSGEKKKDKNGICGNSNSNTLLKDLQGKCRLLEERLEQINEGLSKLRSDPLENINLITALCGEVLGADCALYNRLDRGMLCAWGSWNTPPGYNPRDKSDGHICTDVIKEGGERVIVIRNLQESRYAQTDPNVTLFNLQTYIGRAVKFAGDYVGSLCAVFKRDLAASEDEKKILSLLASVIGVEERRKQVEEELERNCNHLEEQVRERTAELSAFTEKLQMEIAERKNAEEALRESELRLQSILDNTTAVVYLKDLQGRYILINHCYEKLFRIDKKTIVGMTDYDIFPKEMADAFRENDLKVLEAGAPLEFDEIAPHVDGPHTYISIKFPIRDSSGAIYGVCGISTDITVRKNAEEALRESETRYRSLFEGAIEGIIVADIRTKEFRYANPAICKMLGYTEEEMRGMGVDDIHPKESLEHVYSEFEAQARGEKSLASNIPCLRKDGKVIYADINTTRILIDGKECNVGFFTDVTERKQAEEALAVEKELLDVTLRSIGDGVITMDQEGKVVLINKTAEELTGWLQQEAVGRYIGEVFNTVDQRTRKSCEQSLKKVLEKGEIRLNTNSTILIARNGTERVITDSAAPIRDKYGKLIGAVLAFNDIPENREEEGYRRLPLRL